MGMAMIRLEIFSKMLHPPNRSHPFNLVAIIATPQPSVKLPQIVEVDSPSQLPGRNMTDRAMLSCLK
jgi:hypothetical protein